MPTIFSAIQPCSPKKSALKLIKRLWSTIKYHLWASAYLQFSTNLWQRPSHNMPLKPYQLHNFCHHTAAMSLRSRNHANSHEYSAVHKWTAHRYTTHPRWRARKQAIQQHLPTTLKSIPSLKCKHAAVRLVLWGNRAMAKTALEQHTAHFHAKAAKQMSKLGVSNWKPASLQSWNPVSRTGW